MGGPARLGAGRRGRRRRRATTPIRVSPCPMTPASTPDRGRSVRRPASSLGRGPRPLGAEAPPAGASGSDSTSSRGSARSTQELLDRGAGARAVHEPRRRRRADGPARGGHRAADPGRCAGLAGAPAARAALAAPRGGRRVTWPRGRPQARALGRGPAKRAARAGRWTCACRPPRPRRSRRSPSVNGSATPMRSSAWTRGRQVVELFRPALDRLGAVPNAALADRRPGPVRLGGLVVTRQHPMTARARSSWPWRTRPAWSMSRSGRTPGRVCAGSSAGTHCSWWTATSSAKHRGQRGRPRGPAAARGRGGGRRPGPPEGVRQLGYAGMRRLG